MTTIEKIRAEIERRLKDYWKICFHDVKAYIEDSNVRELQELLAFLDTLEEPVSEDLEDCLELNEAAGEYERNNRCSVLGNVDIIDAFKAGAEWQKDKDTEAVIVAEDRGFLKGADWARAEMMEGAVDADVMLTLHDKTGDVSIHTGYLPKDLGIKCDSKVKIIIVKEDGK